jgi:mono/diheme cytochrome c family protein
MKASRIAISVLAVGALAAAACIALTWRAPIEPRSSDERQSLDPALIRRGGELAAMGNCISCHTTPGGKSFAGERALPTPFGTVYSTNITPDPKTGIGPWPEAAFVRAMREGVDRAGRHLYPVFPYDHFTLLTDDDNKALYAYLMSREAVRAQAPANALRFPFNLRPTLAGWKFLNLRKGSFAPDRSRSAEWNRGAYLVEALAHCGACHTPRNRMGAERQSRQFAGGNAEGWTAYALNERAPAPVAWDTEALYFYLRNGWHEAHGVARGPMAAVIDNLASASDADVHAIAVYMAAVAGEPSPERRQKGEALLAMAHSPSDAERNALPGSTISGDVGTAAGGMIYAAACAPCHDGARPIPFGGLHLALSTGTNGPSPRNVINVVLDGLPAAPGEPSPLMPGFAGVLSDAQLGALLAYLRARFTDKPQWAAIEQEVRAARTAARTVYPAHPVAPVHTAASK